MDKNVDRYDIYIYIYILYNRLTDAILMYPMKIMQVCFNMGDAPMCGNLNGKIDRF